MIDLEEVAVALDAFPHWDENMRAEVFHAIDVAPETYVTLREEEVYFKSEAYAAWERIKIYVIDRNGHSRQWGWELTLDEASGYESAPTKEEILKALHRGARMIR